MKKREVAFQRLTRETEIQGRICLDGTGLSTIETGIGFLDHLLATLARHGRFDLELTCRGDLHVDDHHTAEDCALVIGKALDEALGDRAGIVRFGHAYAPLDESLARAVVDLSGRPWAGVSLGLRGPRLGTLSTENVPHVLSSLAMTGRLTMHVDVLRGENDHHRAEAAFKAVALALRGAVRQDGGSEVPSTKGVLG
jgi:imidazoleglycerol phosphate dehydratase HisB